MLDLFLLVTLRWNTFEIALLKVIAWLEGVKDILVQQAARGEVLALVGEREMVQVDMVVKALQEVTIDSDKNARHASKSKYSSTVFRFFIIQLSSISIFIIMSFWIFALHTYILENYIINVKQRCKA